MTALDSKLFGWELSARLKVIVASAVYGLKQEEDSAENKAAISKSEIFFITTSYSAQLLSFRQAKLIEQKTMFPDSSFMFTVYNCFGNKAMRRRAQGMHG